VHAATRQGFQENRGTVRARAGMIGEMSRAREGPAVSGGASIMALNHFRKLAGACGPEPTDRELLERFAAVRDEAAFAELVRRHGPLVLGVCRRLLRDHHDAEDAFQATFLVLAKKAGSVRWRDSATSWLFEVAYRTARKARGRAARRRALE